VPAAYINAAFVDAMISTAVREKLFTDVPATGYVSANFEVVVELASERVRGWAASSGYEDAMGDTTTDPRVKLATFGVFVELAFSRPAKSLPLPRGWADHPAHTAIEEIHAGKLKLVDDPNTSGAVGGMLFSSSTTRPAYTSRDELGDY
jgi:hypothetical protein